MNDLNTLRRAKLYIDKLAGGINPLDDLPLPESDIVNNVRISRCLLYVSNVLADDIKQEERKMRKLIKETPFDLPVENRGLFEFSNYSISVTELVKRINNLIDRETMSPLKLASVTSWLVNTGMLRVEQKSDNSTVKRPTEHGVAIGISVEERVGVRGNYTAVIYNKNAQRFILDNLDAIIEINNKK